MAPDDDDRPAWAEGLLDDSGTLTIFLYGELDIASVDGVREGIEPYFEGAPTRLVFDLGRLAFMDSSGIALLIHTANKCENVEVRNPTPNVLRILEVTGLAKRFGLEP